MSMKKLFAFLVLFLSTTATYAQQNNGEKTISLSSLMKATKTEEQPQQQEVRSVSLSSLLGTMKNDSVNNVDTISFEPSSQMASAQVQAVSQPNKDLLLVGKAIGNIKIGMRMDDVPKSVNGFYANRGEKEMTGEAGEVYMCRDKSNSIMIEIHDQDEDGIVDAFYIAKKGVQIQNSPLYIGMPAEEMLKVEGVKAGTDEYGNEEIRYRDHLLNTGSDFENNERQILYSISMGFNY